MKLHRSPCLLPDCPAEISPEWLFCHDHWPLIPKCLRRELSRMWRRHRYGGRALPPLFFDAVRLAVRAVARAEAARRPAATPDISQRLERESAA